MKTVSFVLPVFNEEKGIRTFYNEVKKAVTSQYHWQFIFINDGSCDRSESILSEIAQEDSRVNVISFSRNFGHQMAITAGIDYAKGDAVIVMDTDLQDPPNIALELVAEWERGGEVVYATRRSRKDTWFKKITAHIFYRLINSLSDVEIPRDTGDFRLMDRKVVEELKKFREHARFMRGLSAFVGFDQRKVLFDRADRKEGETKYPLKKMLKFSADALTAFSVTPLRFISRFGFCTAVLSFVGIIYALIMKFVRPEVTVSGWTFIVIAILFIGGVQMVMIGIVGSYVGRIYNEVRNRPLYIISKVIGTKHS